MEEGRRYIGCCCFFKVCYFVPLLTLKMIQSAENIFVFQSHQLLVRNTEEGLLLYDGEGENEVNHPLTSVVCLYFHRVGNNYRAPQVQQHVATI